MSVKNEFPEYSKVNILIVGTIRDVARSIAKELTNIYNAFSGSNKVKFILIELLVALIFSSPVNCSCSIRYS